MRKHPISGRFWDSENNFEIMNLKTLKKPIWRRQRLLATLNCKKNIQNCRQTHTDRPFFFCQTGKIWFFGGGTKCPLAPPVNPKNFPGRPNHLGNYPSPLSLAGNSTDPCACPDGFSRCNGRCLSWLLNRGSHAEAAERCAALGAHLATPRTERDTFCVKDLTGVYSPWLGWTGGRTEDSFTAADGCGGLGYTDWDTDEPHLADDDNCLMIDGWGKWEDLSCSDPENVRDLLCQVRNCYRPECPDDYEPYS